MVAYSLPLGTHRFSLAQTELSNATHAHQKPIRERSALRERLTAVHGMRGNGPWGRFNLIFRLFLEVCTSRECGNEGSEEGGVTIVTGRGKSCAFSTLLSGNPREI